MAIDKKAIAAMARKKKAKMPKASTKDLKALEVAGVSDDLKMKFFGGTAYGWDGGFNEYMSLRARGSSPRKALAEVWEMSQSELDEFMYGDRDMP